MSRGTLLVIGGEPAWIAALSRSLAGTELRALAADDVARLNGNGRESPDYFLVKGGNPAFQVAGSPPTPGVVGAGGTGWLLLSASDPAPAEPVVLGGPETPPEELARRVTSWIEREELASSQREIVHQLTAAQKELEHEREALRDELERIGEINANVIEALQESLIACDEDGAITHWSRDATELLGWDRAEVIGSPFQSFLHSTEGDGSLLYELLRRGEGRRSLTLNLLTREGEYRLVELRISPLGQGAPGDRGMVVLLTDLARKQREEEQIRRRDRLASLGELSAGVAHEIRNPLAGITTTAELLRARFSDESSEAEFVDVILEEVGRLDKIITDLLTFARPRRPQPVRGDLHRTLDRVLLLLRRQVGKRSIEVVRQYDRGLPPVDLDPDQILQLFLNLGLNSIEAMEDGGTLTVSTRRVAAHRPGDPDRTSTAWTRVMFRDTGCGVAPEARDKVFNPFFTTKGRGSGLGLAICQRIVEDHQGIIDLESSPGQGTTVVVDFPMTQAAARVDPQTELFGAGGAP